MSLILLVFAVFSFLLEALAPVFDWSLGEYNAIAWGLTGLAASFLVPAWRSRA